LIKVGPTATSPVIIDAKLKATWKNVVTEGEQDITVEE